MSDALDALISDALGGSSVGGSSDVLDQLINEALTPEEPSLGSRAISGIVNAPTALWDQVTAIPSGVANTYTSLKSLAESLFSGSTDPLVENKETLDKTARGWGALASGAAGAELGLAAGTAAAPFTAGLSIPIGLAAGGALGLLGFNKANQLTGADEATTLRQDVGDLVENTAMGLTLAGAAKGAGALAKKAPKLASDLDRKSLQTRASDYGKGSEIKTVETPEGIPETFVKSTLNNLLEEGKLGSSRNPAKLAQVIDNTSEGLSSAIDTLVQNFDESNKLRKIDPPPFQHALEYLGSGKVPGDQIESFFNKLIKLDEGIINEGRGKLSFLQEQKKAVGVAYDRGDANLKGFNQAIYRDLKEHIEQYVPEVKGLNQELQKFEIVRPIVERSLKASENKDALTKLRDVVYTTGGIGAPTIAGSVLGGPLGAAFGAGIGLTGKALASPQGLATTAKILRGVGKAAPVFEGLFTPSKIITDRSPPKLPSRSNESFKVTDRIKGLDPESAALQEQAISRVENNLEELVSKYVKTEFKPKENVLTLDTDLARKFTLPDHNNAKASHEASSALVKEVGARALESPSFKKVAIVTGGPGSGKSTATKNFKNALIFDKILKTADQGELLIKQIQESGKTPSFSFVYTAPEVALKRAWGRSLSSGRAVPFENFAKHALDTVESTVKLIDRYAKKKESVPFKLLDNTGKKAVKMSLDDLRKLEYNNSVVGVEGFKARLRPLLDDLYEQTKKETPKSDWARIDDLYRQYTGIQSEPSAGSGGRGRIGSNDKGARASGAGKRKQTVASSEKLGALAELGIFSALPSKNSEQITTTPKAQLKGIGAVFSKPKGATDLKPINEVEAEIDKDPYYSALYEAESSRDPKAMPPIDPKTGKRISSAKGGFQFLDATAKAMKLDDPFDLEKSFEKVQELTDQHRVRFGDDPEMLYAAHYLGASVLKKYLEGQDLTEKEESQVEYFKEKALPRFLRIYQKVKLKSVEA